MKIFLIILALYSFSIITLILFLFTENKIDFIDESERNEITPPVLIFLLIPVLNILSFIGFISIFYSSNNKFIYPKICKLGLHKYEEYTGTIMKYYGRKFCLKCGEMKEEKEEKLKITVEDIVEERVRLDKIKEDLDKELLELKRS